MTRGAVDGGCGDDRRAWVARGRLAVLRESLGPVEQAAIYARTCRVQNLQMDRGHGSEARVVSIGAPASVRRMRLLNPNAPIDELDVSSLRQFDEKLAREVSRWQSIRRITVRCPTTKAALRQLLSTPGLEEISLVYLDRHGSLGGMPKPTDVHALRCGFLSSDALLTVADLPGLRTLSAQHTRLSLAAISRLVGMQSLSHLDLEASNLDDDMASILALSTGIVSLDIGATRIGTKGLQRICQMSQLRELDIWALDIRESDLDLLAELEGLEYLSLGGHEGQTVLTARGVLPQIARLPSLRRLWFDGIPLTPDEIAALERRYERVTVT